MARKKGIKVECPYCKGQAKLVDSKIIYGKSYGLIWLCAPCNAYCGVHKNSHDHAPLGTPANAELRKLRLKVHELFDPLWKTGRHTRNAAYGILSTFVGIRKKDTHIGRFNETQCKKAIAKLLTYKETVINETHK